MTSSEINEPIILSSKKSDTQFYLSLFLPTFLVGNGLYLFFESREVILLLSGIALAWLNWRGRYKNEIYLTQVAIYKRLGKRKYRSSLFSDLDYAYFENEDSIFLMFGPEGTNDYMTMNHEKNYDEIQAFLQNVSLNSLPHHRYEYVDRENISDGDKLGCLDCKSKFGFSAITKWADEKSRNIFRVTKSNIAVCPSCRVEGTVVVSRAGNVTNEGLKALSALRSER